jgi:hypothetical protein
MRKVQAVDTLGHVVRRLRGLASRRPSLSHTPKHLWRPRHLRAREGRSLAAAGSSSRRLILGATLGFLAFTAAIDAPPTVDSGATAATVMAGDARSADSRASRGDGRSPAPSSPPSATTSPAPAPSKPSAPAKPKPVAWLNQAQMDNAEVIVRTGREAGLPKRAHVIAVATAIQESKLLNLANPAVPQSLRLKSQGVGYDHDSVGLFQQRPSAGWGTPAQLLDPEYAARQFYNRLVQVPGWQNMSLTWAAQSVQVSAFPYAYAQHERLAQQIVDTITPYLDAVAKYEDAMAKYEEAMARYEREQRQEQPQQDQQQQEQP